MKSQLKDTKILLTGGHMTPALAVLEELRQRGYSNFVWVGHKYNQTGALEPSAEYKTVSAMGDVKFIDLPAGKVVRSWRINFRQFVLAVKNLLKIPYGMLYGAYILLKERPQVVLSFGGYIAVPIVVWAKLLGIKAVTHEQTVITGLSNRVLGFFADKIYISWPDSAKFYPKSKTLLTGNPLRQDIFEIKSTEFQFPNELPTIYVTGGNQGAVILNRAVIAALAELLQFANVIHQTGSAAESKQLVQALDLPAEVQSRYIAKDYIFAGEIGEAFAKADLVVARSGANTVCEIIALQKPAVFVPIPWVTKNEQYLNAKFAEALGLAKIIAQKDLNAESLLSTVRQSLQQILAGKGFNDLPLPEVKHKSRQALPEQPSKVLVDSLESFL